MPTKVAGTLVQRRPFPYDPTRESIVVLIQLFRVDTS
jgi:hypothetical protein